MKRDLKQARQCSLEHRPAKKAMFHKNVHAVKCPGVVTIFSNDILHHIFGFLLSKSGSVVDGRSLRSASLVSKQWRDVVHSSSLWANLVRVPGDDSVDSIGRSLQIREMSGREGTSKESLIGFVKLDRNDFDSNSDVINFRVLERATKKKCILSIAKNEHKTPDMMKEIYEAHFLQKERFLKPRKGQEITSHFRCRFPLGVCVLNGRVVRWYEDSKAKDRLRQRVSIPARRGKSCEVSMESPASGRLDALKNLKLDQEVKHLLNLERTYGALHASRPHVRMDCWATVVDWVIEIVECFNLEDQAAFHAMSLFDRFISTNMQRVKMCHYQLVAGACLLIASKCSEHSISSNDISFCSDNLFNADQVTGTEDFILRQLDWKLAFPTSLAFMISYTRLLGIDSDSQVFLMMRYVVELALQSPIYLTYKPSMIAASAVVLARFCMQESEIWSEALEQETSYSLNDLCNCTMELSGLLENIRATMPELIMISRRYRKSSRQSVASISIPSISSFDSLVSYHESFFRRQSNGIPA